MWTIVILAVVAVAAVIVLYLLTNRGKTTE